MTSFKAASHAQCKQRRRIENRNDPHGPQVGATIPGLLTATEIAHKVRRKARRVVILNRRLKEVDSNLMNIQKKRHELKDVPADEAALNQAKQTLTLAHNNWSTKRSELLQQIARLNSF